MLLLSVILKYKYLIHLNILNIFYKLIERLLNNYTHKFKIKK